MASSEDAAKADQVRVLVTDEGARSRLTVFFRLLLALPHLLLLGLWTVPVFVLAAFNWFVALLTGRTLGGGFQAAYIRYFTHVLGYLALAANPFPDVAGGAGSYPLDVEISRPERQSRWKTLFRFVLVVPALLLGVVFASFQLGGQAQSGGEYEGASAQLVMGIIATAAILGWFASLARGRMPDGLRDLAAYGIGYLAQLAAYALLVTDRYPNSDPLYPQYGNSAPPHNVRIDVSDDLRRSRLTVFFRLLLWLPHLIWLFLWGLVVAVAVFANWFVTLIAGRPAAPLFRFTARYVRYATHVTAFLYLVANPFPGFAGEPGAYPVDLELPAPSRQNRWKTAFRLILAFPAFLVAGALGNAFVLVAVFGWFTGVFLGRMPNGLRKLGAFALRYNAQVGAYFGLLTDRYPYAGPTLEAAGPTLAAAGPTLAAPDEGEIAPAAS